MLQELKKSDLIRNYKTLTSQKKIFNKYYCRSRGIHNTLLVQLLSWTIAIAAKLIQRLLINILINFSNIGVYIYSSIFLTVLCFISGTAIFRVMLQNFESTNSNATCSSESGRQRACSCAAGYGIASVIIAFYTSDASDSITSGFICCGWVNRLLMY